MAGPYATWDSPTPLSIMVGGNSELQNHTNRLVNRLRENRIKVGTEKSKMMPKSANNIRSNISMDS